MEFTILKKSIGVQRQCDVFLDQVSQAGLIFRQGMEEYLKGETDTFMSRLKQIRDVEHEADDLRRVVEERIFRKTLIPESRGDVLELLEDMDALLGRFKEALMRLDIEKPQIPEALHVDFMEMTKCVAESVEAAALSCRAFFKDITAVSDHIHKISFWEKESDRVSLRLRRAIFDYQTTSLCYKLQLNILVRYIDKIANQAEDVGDNLAIYVVKRTV